MYNYFWDNETGGYLLDTKLTGIVKEVRPVYKEELRLLGFDNQFGWNIPDMDLPLMWAEGRRYIYLGECVGEANGGSLYEMPTLKAHVSDLEIQPVNIERMVEKNQPLLTGLVQKTLKFIYDTFKAYEKRTDIAYVAFSGGKDSVVMLDLVQRALPHDAFKVVFGDTTMELQATHDILNASTNKWMDLSWYIAKASFSAFDTWEKFGPPARLLRWCCSVHKSAPSILKLKEILAEERKCEILEITKFKALAFLGVRAEESEARSAYDFISDGKKHAVQINCNPILEWGTGELFIYIFSHKLPLNEVYKYGAHRVGCLMCPMSSKWYECILNHVYPDEVSPYASIIVNSIKKDYDDKSEWNKYMADGGWKQRASGKALKQSSNKVIELNADDEVQFIIRNSNYKWNKWLKVIGTTIKTGKNEFQLEYKDVTAIFFVVEDKSSTTITLKKPLNAQSAIRFIYLFKNAIYKAAYCENCKVCMVECPVGALDIKNNDISIGDCIHCEGCLEVGKRGCLVCKSKMSVGDNNMSMKNIDRYKNFGLRQEWLEIFFENMKEFWKNERMGSHMFLSFKVWGKEAGMLDKNSAILPATYKLCDIGSDSALVWSYIFNNIAYNSAIFGWYINNCIFDTSYLNNDLQIMLGDDYSETTKKNALSAMKDTIKSSPIGWLLGQGECEMKGKVIVSLTRYGWQNPEPLAILYSLYKYAEKSDNFYSFTVSDLFDEETERGGISPIKLYNIDRETIVSISKGLAREYIDYIKVNFNKNMMEDIYLDSTKTSFDVVNLF